MISLIDILSVGGRRADRQSGAAKIGAVFAIIVWTVAKVDWKGSIHRQSPEPQVGGNDSLVPFPCPSRGSLD